MTGCIRLTIALSAMLGFVAATAPGDELEAVEQKILEAWNKQRSVFSRIEMEGTVGDGRHGGTSIGEGTCELMRKGDKTLTRVTMKTTVTMEIGDKERKMEQESTLIVDGAHAYTLATAMGHTTAMKLDIDPRMSGDPKAMLDYLRKDHELKLLPEQDVDGATAYVIEAIAREGTNNPLPRMRLFFDQNTGFMVRSTSHDANGRRRQMMRYKNVQYDIKIDPDRFVFELPPGVELLDRTSDSRKVQATQPAKKP